MNHLPLRRRTLYPAELRRRITLIILSQSYGFVKRRIALSFPKTCEQKLR